MTVEEVMWIAFGAVIVIGLVVGSVVAFVRGRRDARRADEGRWASWRDEPKSLELKNDNGGPIGGGGL
ncbi:MAG TPA: hypothetical protein VHN77_03790 [Phycisphaerales bacterium]|nr:hypothetical protein [Phycisphaerales bacterium]